MTTWTRISEIVLILCLTLCFLSWFHTQREREREITRRITFLLGYKSAGEMWIPTVWEMEKKQLKGE